MNPYASRVFSSTVLPRLGALSSSSRSMDMPFEVSVDPTVAMKSRPEKVTRSLARYSPRSLASTYTCLKA